MVTDTLSAQGHHISVAGRLMLYIRRRRYECLLLSFTWLIFGNTFSQHSHIAAIIDIYQNLITGFLVFYKKKWLRIFILCVLLLTLALDLVEMEVQVTTIRNWLGILYLIFFFLVSKEVYKEVLYSKNVSRELLSAAFCGFVLLCLIGTFLFFLIETFSPNSFSHTGDAKDVLTNLDYFSFTTLLTIGYGDITPVSVVAKRAVMMMGLAGHFYTVFVTSIIIGKYLSVNKSPNTPDT